jgi:uncharacterized protein YjbI with pentapeptide repeats
MKPKKQPSISTIGLEECGNGGEDNTSGKSLEEGKLTEADFPEANLNELSFIDDLSSAKIAETDFGSFNLAGKELPNFLSERFNYTIELISEVAKNMQKICLILIVVSVYIAFTISHIEDQHLFIKHTQIQLPIINVKMSSLFFLLPAQLTMLIIFLYFQIYRRHVISLIGDLPTVFPDGVKRSDKLHPWTLLMRLNRTQSDSSPKWTSVFPGLLSWGLVPFISALILIRTLKSQNTKLSISVCVIFLVTCLITFTSNKWVNSESRNENSDKDRKISVGFIFKQTWIIFPIILCITVTLTVIGIKGNLLPFELENAVLEEMDLKEFNLRRANLNGANLENALLCKVNLKNASLDRAKCKGANFSFANLNGAYLNSSKLMEAKFIATKFIEAHLIRANLSDANLSDADFKGAVLIFTNFTGADLKDTKFDGANLTSANFKGAKNLTIDQFAEVKTLRYAQFDQELEKQIRKKYPHLLE